jgi:hypothetical protein
MPRKRKNGDSSDEMWINPNFNLKGARGDRAWENRIGGPPSSSRFLEFADIALGIKKPAGKMKRFPIHEVKKKEPYSQT